MVGKSSNSEDLFYIDSEDYNLIKDCCWRVQIDKRNNYKRLVTSIHLSDGKCKIKTIWSMITGYDYVDHKDGNTMNNRRNNLRQSNHLLNMQNRKTHKNNKSSEPGIRICNNKYIADIRFNNKDYVLGTYNDFDTALKVRIRAEAAVFDREYAPHRNLFEQYNINIEYEKKYWNEWITKTNVNYLGEPTHPWQRKVVQLTLNGVYVNTFESITIAANKTGVNQSNICSCCNHKACSAGGYLWVLEDEYNPDEIRYTYHSKATKKAVIKLSMSGEFIKEYDTISMAAFDNNIDKSTICACCRGRQKTAGGFRWMYKEDYDELTKQND